MTTNLVRPYILVGYLADRPANPAQRNDVFIAIDTASPTVYIATEALVWVAVGTFAAQTATHVFAGPTGGGPAAPAFRALVAGDIPTLSITGKTSGTLPANRGGTGLALTVNPPSNEILVWDVNTGTFTRINARYIETGLSTRLYEARATVTISASTTETTMLSGTASGAASIPANILIDGSRIRIKLGGTISSAAVAGNITIRGKVGGTTVCASTAAAITNNLAGRRWFAEIELVVRTSGASGTITGGGQFVPMVTATTNNFYGLPPSGAPTVAIDTTVINAVDATFQWGTNSGSNILNVEHAEIELII